MSEKYLPVIIRACNHKQSVAMRSKALIALQLLTRREGNKAALLSAGALGVLVDALKCTDPEMEESTKRFAAVAICDLIQGSAMADPLQDINKYCIIELGVLDPIKRILTSTTIRNNELKYWTLMILYQISLSVYNEEIDPMPKILIHSGFVSLLAKMARVTYGNTNMPKFCMQSLVRIVASVDVVEAKKILTELLDYQIVELISICLRGDDVELIYWAAGLMHEFVLKDVAADKFREIKGVHSILASLLSADEMYIARVVLRTVKFMAYGQETFRQDMVHTGMVKKIMHCLTLDDDDVRYWATLCIHAVAGQVESHEDILGSSEFELLLSLATSVKVHVSIFIADILSLICCIPSNNIAMECHVDAIISTLNSLITLDELEVQYNAAGAIFNLMAMRDDFTEKVRDKCLDTIISTCVNSTHERVQLTCAKTSIMMAIKYQHVIPRVTLQVIDPLVNSCVEISRHILPIIMMQSLITAKKGALPHGTDQSNRDASYNSSLESDGVFVPDYININTAGTISNAMRLEEILHNSARLVAAPTEGSFTEHAHAPPVEDISGFLNSEEAYAVQQQAENRCAITNEMSPSDLDRASLFMGFELPLSSRVQFVGALSALRILLENSDISNNVISGAILENLMAQMENWIEKDYNVFDKERQRSYKLSDIKVHTCCSKFTKPQPISPLPDNIRQFTESLLLLSLYPVLETWTLFSSNDIDLEQMHPGTIKQVYYDFLQWIHASTIINIESCTRVNDRSEVATYAPDGFLSDSESIEQREKYRILKKLESAAERMGETRRRGEDSPVDDLTTEGRSSHLSKMYSGFATRALMVLRSVIRYGLCNILIPLESLSLNLSLCRIGQKFLGSKYELCGGHDIYTSEQAVFGGLCFGLFRCSVELRIIMAYASRIIAERKVSECRNSKAFVEIDLVKRSKFCLVNYETIREFRNDSWTFETVKGTHATPASDTWDGKDSHKYAFEVVLASDGLMQVGWVNDDFEIDPEGGTGVGDDDESYGYDGYRAKKWHGRHSISRASYGNKWAPNDVITSCLDLDQGEIRYYKNGIDMGVAFTDIARDRSWYPAISISTGQGCEFRFGGPLDRLKYLPEGYLPIASLLKGSEITSEACSTQIQVKNENSRESSSEESDLDALVDALGRMSVKSPKSERVIENGNREPNLRPIDAQGFHGYCDSAEGTLSVRRSLKEDEALLPSLYFEVAIVYQAGDMDQR
ncbi:hypothetical protein EC973_005725 [Apophysomyces ossiformis]|uniref:B30.2/SPRY domain-containing protein n=1 Tax=Apophysomyces ossiformis TaxID=679940 RepID=A0A8H7BP74_9FUNG|nr:hypothetical protein EC973_005725 [Apophysomyces ossiformis]